MRIEKVLLLFAELYIVMPFGYMRMHEAGIILILEFVDIGSIRIELIPQDAV